MADILGGKRLRQAGEHAAAFDVSLRLLQIFKLFMAAWTVMVLQQTTAQSATSLTAYSKDVSIQKFWCGGGDPVTNANCGYSTDSAALNATLAGWNAYNSNMHNIYPNVSLVIETNNGCDGSGVCSVHFVEVDGNSYNVNGQVVHVDKIWDAPIWIGSNITCPVHSTGTGGNPPTGCICNIDFMPDLTATSCVPVSDCPIPGLTPFNDACSQALENLSSTQAQKNAACGTLTPAMQTGQTCLESKLAAMTPVAIPFVRTADVRSVAYQAYFREIWDKMEDLVRLESDPAKHAACAARRAEIAAEKGCDNAGSCAGACYAPSATQRSHCFRGIPANPDPNGAQHTQGNAIDVSRTGTIEPLQVALATRTPPQTIPQFLDAPTNCNLIWGGTFTNNYDPVHFLAR